MISVTLSFQLAFIVLLYAGLFLQQVNVLRSGTADTLSITIIVFLAVILVVLLPLQFVRIRRARRYARNHAAEITEPAGATASGVVGLRGNIELRLRLRFRNRQMLLRQVGAIPRVPRQGRAGKAALP